MSEEPSSGEKAFEPTPQKLESARRKGDIPRSMDVSAALVFVAFLLVISLGGAAIIDPMFMAMRRFLSDADQLGATLPGAGSQGLVQDFALNFFSGATWLFLLPFLAAVLAFVGQNAIIISPEKLKPKLSRLSLISNAKNKFGTSGLVQFFKNLVKATAVSIALFYYLNQRWDVFFDLIHGTERQVVQVMGETIISLLIVACIIFSSIAFIDLLWQRYHHMQKMRMTFQEVRDEQKQSEGDPHLKAERRQKGYELATNRMLVDVPDADVVIVNPTHFAVALSWSRTKGEAPKCVAKGTDEIAARIREMADEHAVPIFRDPPTARALYSSVEVGHEIDPEHFRAVAAAIRFAEQMRKKAGRD